MVKSPKKYTKFLFNRSFLTRKCVNLTRNVLGGLLTQFLVEFNQSVFRVHVQYLVK